MFKLPQHSSLPVPSHIRQIDGLQLLRAVAVILVAWFHSAELIPSAWSLDLGTFGVDIFFVISGFILSLVVLRERRPPGLATSWAFLSRRLLRIFPIYWVFCAAFAARQMHAHLPINRDQWFSVSLLPSPWSSYPLFLVAFAWTLVFEMFFYYVFALTLLATVRYATYLLIVILTALVLIGTLLDIRHPVAIIVFNPVHLEFIFGAAVAQAYAHWGPRRRLGIALAAIGTVLTLIVRLHPNPWIATGFPTVMANRGVLQSVATWGVAAALIVAGTVFWSPKLNTRLGKTFVVLGTASYSTYLISPWCQEYIERAADRLCGQPIGTATILAYRLVILVGTLFIGWLIYNFIEWPLLRKLQSRLLPRSS